LLLFLLLLLLRLCSSYGCCVNGGLSRPCDIV